MINKNKEYMWVPRDYSSITSNRKNTTVYYPEEYLGSYSSYEADNNYLDNFNSSNDPIVDVKGSGFFTFLRAYLNIRIRQLSITLNLFSKLIVILILELKTRLVRNMYWGRTSFYKTAFHFVVVAITLLAFSTGLSARILLPQRDTIRTVSVSASSNDTDLVNQQGSFFPIDQLNGNFDSLYENYTVKGGDSISSIAAEYQLTQDTIRWANDIPANKNDLQPGQVLRLPRINGVFYVAKEGDTVDSVLNKYQLRDKEVNKFDLLELNSRLGAIDPETEKLIAGKTIFIPDATIPAPKTTVRAPARTPSRPTTTGPVRVNASGFVNPMQQAGGYRFVRGYHPRHTGVDLAVPRGSIIVAAASGTVTKAGACYGGFGYCVIIKHANGLSTAYAHGNGVMYVSSGQNVQAGQRIMQSGCSGNCYGAHLHISLAANNNDVYGCYSCRINPAGIIPY